MPGAVPNGMSLSFEHLAGEIVVRQCCDGLNFRQRPPAEAVIGTFSGSSANNGPTTGMHWPN